MFINHSTKLGYGFIVTKDEYLSLSKEKLNKFQEDDYTLALNSWADDATNYFFGLELKNIGPGEMTTLNFDYKKYPDGTLEKLKNHYHYYFPNSTAECNYWMLCCIDKGQ